MVMEQGTFTGLFGSTRCTKCPFRATPEGSSACVLGKPEIDEELQDFDDIKGTRPVVGEIASWMKEHNKIRDGLGLADLISFAE